MNKHTIFATHFQWNLANRFQKRQAFNVTDGAANLGDDNICVGISEILHHLFNFVRNVRNHLHSLAKEFAAALLVNHREINLTCCVVALTSQRCGGKPLVVA